MQTIANAVPAWYIVVAKTQRPTGSKHEPIWLSINIGPQGRRDGITIQTSCLDQKKSLIEEADLSELLLTLADKPDEWWADALLDKASVQILKLRPGIDPVKMHGF